MSVVRGKPDAGNVISEDCQHLLLVAERALRRLLSRETLEELNSL
jgi:hypothetical protein